VLLVLLLAADLKEEVLRKDLAELMRVNARCKCVSTAESLLVKLRVVGGVDRSALSFSSRATCSLAMLLARRSGPSFDGAAGSPPPGVTLKENVRPGLGLGECIRCVALAAARPAASWSPTFSKSRRDGLFSLYHTAKRQASFLACCVQTDGEHTTTQTARLNLTYSNRDRRRD